jgi:hypothetical protein
MSNRTMSPALFKSAVDSAALRLAEERPLGFAVDDVAAVIGCADITRQMRRRIRQRLVTLCNAERLFSPQPWTGVYLGSDKTGAALEIAHQPVLLDDVRRAFFDAGGFMQMPEIIAALGFDAGSEKRVRAVMSESHLFERFTPLKGMRKHWRLSDSERATVPVPGRWMLADLQLKVFRMAGGKIPWSWGLKDALEAQRVRVGNGLRDARMLWRLSPEEMVADAGISGALDACLSGATELRYQDPQIIESSGYKVAEWWDDCKEAMGTEEASAEAWRMLEGEDGQPYLLDALDVAAWVTIGARMKLDPALLSRGAHDYKMSGPLPRDPQHDIFDAVDWG